MSNRLLNTAVLVAALGYFVDIYDLLLFIIVGKNSLTDLGFCQEGGNCIDNTFLFLANTQMVGMLVGGILWGVLGDKKGRLSVLFGSIFLYSIANIANAMVHTETAYMLCRFVAGVGLAGELGAGVTLVSEILPKEKRGYGVTIVAAVGLSGAVVAAFIGLNLDWRTCYYIGGGLGLSLLLLRVGVSESGMFKTVQEGGGSRGNFFALFTPKERFWRYMRCIFVGLPTWFVVGILVGLSFKFAEKLGVSGEVKNAYSVMYTYTGLVLGDIASGLLSQYLRSRKKVMLYFLLFNLAFVIFFLNIPPVSAQTFYLLYGVMGFSVGFWIIFVTIAAEQFGTNLRATVATTVPNFIRGSLPPLTMLFTYLRDSTGSMLLAAGIVAAFTTIVSLVCLFFMEETFGKELDYVE